LFCLFLKKFPFFPSLCIIVFSLLLFFFLRGDDDVCGRFLPCSLLFYADKGEIIMDKDEKAGRRGWKNDEKFIEERNFA
jgi:hypothetical protein